MQEYEYFDVQNAAGGVANILLYDRIGVDDKGGGISGKRFAEELFRLAKRFRRINVRINSPGGKVTDGLSICAAILNINKSVPGIRIDTYIDGLALSIAGLIAVCGKRVYMCNFGQLMLHNPFPSEDNKAEGAELDKTLVQIKEILLTLLATRTGQNTQVLSVMMNNTTWLGAETAQRQGFVDEIFDHPKKKALSTSITAAASNEELLFDIFNQFPIDFLSEPKPNPMTIVNQVSAEEVERLRNEMVAFKGDLAAITNACGLTTDAGRDGIIAHINTQGEEIKRLQTLELSIDSYKTKIENIENEKKRLVTEVAEMKKYEAVNLVENAIKEGKIPPAKKEKWLNHAYNNYEMVRETLADMPVHPTLASKIKAMGLGGEGNGKGTEGINFNNLSFSDLSNHHPEKLMLIKNENPVLYRKLYRKEYEVEPSI